MLPRMTLQGRLLVQVINAGDDPVAQEVGIRPKLQVLYIAVAAIVIDQDAVTNDEGRLPARWG